MGYAWRYRRNVILALGSSLAGMAVMALVPLITKVVIDDVIGTGTRSIAVWTGLLIAAAVEPRDGAVHLRTEVVLDVQGEASAVVAADVGHGVDDDGRGYQ
ncbi:hypothetical protein, partial [Streptomyces niveus]|uniref:hypothetical protein n=1 Tax=Streptomyces niveus TaxID=193462 RepID=UPI0020D27E54